MKMEPTPQGRRLIAEENFTAAHADSLVDFIGRSLEEETRALFLDLDAVATMDDQGVRLLAGLALGCRQKEIPLHVEAARPEVQRLLAWCRLPGQVLICGDAADDAPGQ
ncbi:MAG TPA: STAS domain-containing protein [Gammaproteobacteria bacterium]|nr:STAS domain-containing protein [Gammaproteobacteria bacterium]